MTFIITMDFNDLNLCWKYFTVPDKEFDMILNIFKKVKPIQEKYSPRIEEFDFTAFDEKYGQVLTEEELEKLKDFVFVDEYGYGEIYSVKFFIGEPINVI